MLFRHVHEVRGTPSSGPLTITIGFGVMRFIGYFIKLIHIPINSILLDVISLQSHLVLLKSNFPMVY
jgi:hypothetical protein